MMTACAGKKVRLVASMGLGLSAIALVLGGCSTGGQKTAGRWHSADRSGSNPAPVVMASEFSSGRVVASDGMGSAMNSTSVAGAEGE